MRCRGIQPGYVGVGLPEIHHRVFGDKKGYFCCFSVLHKECIYMVMCSEIPLYVEGAPWKSVGKIALLFPN